MAHEFALVGCGGMGRRHLRGFVELARGMGVPGRRITKPNELADAVREAFDAGGPRLVEVIIEGKR